MATSYPRLARGCFSFCYSFSGTLFTLIFSFTQNLDHSRGNGILVAQTNNPCPVFETDEVFSSGSAINVYETPKANSQIIANLAPGQPFQLARLSPSYYDNTCWYNIVFSVNGNTGWIGMEAPATSYIPDRPPEIPSPEPVVPPPATTPRPQTPRPELREPEPIASPSANGPELDTLVIGLIFIIGVGISIAVISKAAILLLSSLSPKPKPPALPSRKKSAPKAIAKGKTIMVNYDPASFATSELEPEPDPEIRAIVQELAKSTISEPGEPLAMAEETNVSPGHSLQYIITSFNQGNQQLFDDQDQFQRLKPLEKFIHGAGGNLGITGQTEFEAADQNQASYLAFTADGDIWLIPNPQLGRWQRLLQDSSIFDMVGSSPQPKLHTPARLQTVSENHWQLTSKGIFN